MYDIKAVRECFPILSRHVGGHPLVYLDNASTSQKPNSVIEAIADFYRHHCGNVHRGVHTLTDETTDMYDDARKTVARFIGARDHREIVFTRNTTEAIHLAMYSWARERVCTGDEIIVSEMEHHSNLLPWQMLAREKGAELRFLGLGPDDTLDPDEFDRLITPRTRIASLVHVSNTLGVINPAAELAGVAATHGVPLFFDGAQAVPHMNVDVADLGCDFYAFSSHKMCGPAGIGVLWAKRERLEEMTPFLAGGGALDEVGRDGATFNEVPHKFESGTPAVADAIGLGEAIRFLESLGMENVRSHEELLVSRALEAMEADSRISVYGPDGIDHRAGVISFNMKGIEPFALGRHLDRHGVAIRAGDHCTQPLLRSLGITATARVSFYLYNTTDEVDLFTSLLHEVAARPTLL